MRGDMVIIGLLITSAMAILLVGCTSKVVMVRPPEYRVEVHGPPPYSEAVWIPGYWKHGRREWVWVQGHWARPPRPHAVWIPGYWELRRGGWIWVLGHWEYR